jgi:N-acetylglucosamine kinase-like BadF-type ATPase
MFGKKAKPMSESEAIARLNDAIKSAIRDARSNGIHPARINNALTGHAGEVMSAIYRAQERRQFA